MALSKQAVNTSYANTFVRADELPEHVRDCKHPIELEFEMPDFAEVMRQGWQWIFDGMKSARPLTWAELDSQTTTLEYREIYSESCGERFQWGDLLLCLRNRNLPVFPIRAAIRLKSVSLEVIVILLSHHCRPRLRTLTTTVRQAWVGEAGCLRGIATSPGYGHIGVI